MKRITLRHPLLPSTAPTHPFRPSGRSQHLHPPEYQGHRISPAQVNQLARLIATHLMGVQGRFVLHIQNSEPVFLESGGVEMVLPLLHQPSDGEFGFGAFLRENGFPNIDARGAYRVWRELVNDFMELCGEGGVRRMNAVKAICREPFV